MKTNVKKASAAYDAGNRIAARVIVANPAKYPGVMQTWAALVIEKAQPTIKGPLFRAA